MATRPTAVDLFSGAGGGSLGLIQAGYDVRFAVEVDAFAAATHRANLPGLVLEEDIRGLSAPTILESARVSPGELDLLFAGPPCQGFSMIGPREVSDMRNILFREVLRFAGIMRPKAVVIENVPGLVTLDGGGFLASILGGLKDLGYNAACAELLAAQYGAAQMRWRLVIVAFREDLGIEGGYGFPQPTHGTLGIGDLVSNVTVPEAAYDGFVTTRDAIADLPVIAAGEYRDRYSGRPRTSFQAAARTRLDGSPMGRELFDHYAAALSEANITRLAALRPGQDWRDLPFDLLPPSMRRALRKDHTRRFRRMTWSGVPRSIITRFRDPKSGEYSHPTQNRTISIREAARIQGFPDWFAFQGPNTSKYVQVGNAIPVQLARAVGAEVSRVLTNGARSERLLSPFRRRRVAILDSHGQLSRDAA